MESKPQHEDFFRKELVEELRRIEAMIRKETNIEKKIFYFSAAYGITNRTYRFAFSKEVLVADILLQNTYNMLNERLQLIRAGDRNVVPDQLVFDKLCDGLHDLADNFESGGDIFEPLMNIVTAGFATTGPGGFMREKGDLVL